MDPIYMGDNARIDVVAKLTDGSFLDLTGALLVATLKARKEDADPGLVQKRSTGLTGGGADQIAVSDAVHGELSVFLTPVDTVKPPAEGDYPMDVVVKTGLGEVYTLVLARIPFKKRVTATFPT